ncbi:MAG: hypothetical protein O2868_18165 [Proteobacteria bacterium]|nr:hypothetical protein [Pseudomonadota bacterium]
MPDVDEVDVQVAIAVVAKHGRTGAHDLLQEVISFDTGCVLEVTADLRSDVDQSLSIGWESRMRIGSIAAGQNGVDEKYEYEERSRVPPTKLTCSGVFWIRA